MKNTLIRIWKGTHSLETFSLESHHAQKIAGGLIHDLTDGHYADMKYQLVLDQWWRVKSVKITMLSNPYKFILLTADGYGRWFDQNNQHLPELDGCVDVDISATPFTNTLPIRRLDETLSETQQLKVVYISVPTLCILPVIQCYTRISDRRYWYENVDTGFKSELLVDEYGLVAYYPHLFEAVYSLD